MSSKDDDKIGGIDFCTLGMFIIDDIEYEPPRPPAKDILGGAGTYGALGARIAAQSTRSKSVGWIVDAGSDFPQECRSVIDSWKTSCVIREDTSRLTTRGWNGYIDDKGTRAFKYLTPKIRLDENSLPISHLFSKSFHLICSPKRCIQICDGIMRRRREADPSRSDRPIFVWEPVPDLCVAVEKEPFLEALKSVNVVSPNEAEFASFWGRKTWEFDSEGKAMVSEILEAGIGADGNGSLLIRVGKDGCHAFSRVGSFWVPAFHQTSEKVLDPTGAGNTFLGALAQRMASDAQFEKPLHNALVTAFEELKDSGSGSWPEFLERWGSGKAALLGMIWGSIAAGIAVESVGMPIFRSADGHDLWNDVSIDERISLYARHLGRLIPQRGTEVLRAGRVTV